MIDYVLMTDSTSDLTKRLIDELEITVLPLQYIIDGKTFVDIAENDDKSIKDLYQKMREGATSTTSQITLQSFLDAFTPVLKEGKDILYIGFSSGLSGTVGQAMLAAKESLEEVADWLESNKLRQAHWFTVDDLHFLKRGGRVSPAVAIIGTVLGIKPVMHVDDEGHLIKVGTVRGRKASLDELVKRAGATIEDAENQTIFICHGDCFEDAQYVANKAKEELKVKDVIIGYTGPVIGSHSGPGTMAIFTLGKNRD